MENWETQKLIFFLTGKAKKFIRGTAKKKTEKGGSWEKTHLWPRKGEESGWGSVGYFFSNGPTKITHRGGVEKPRFRAEIYRVGSKDHGGDSLLSRVGKVRKFRGNWVKVGKVSPSGNLSGETFKEKTLCGKSWGLSGEEVSGR